VRRVALGVALLVLVATGVVAYLHQGSPAALLARKGQIARVETTPASADERFTYTDVTIHGSTGLVVQARVRAPRGRDGALPGAVLVGGLNRGRRVVEVRGLDAIARDAVLVSPDYAIDEHRRAWRGLALASSATKIRSAALDGVAAVPLLLDYLATRPDVRGDTLFVVGSSLGAPIVTIAGAIDARPRAVVALYSGGDLPRLLTHALAYDGLPRWQAWIAGHALAWWVAPLEPVRYAGRIAPRAFLMINGADDSLIPRANVLALYDAARAPKELTWISGEHVQPDEDALIERLSGVVAGWLAARGLLQR
jgi:cephalosporin-C deacetylase-like acetyl esterase